MDSGDVGDVDVGGVVTCWRGHSQLKFLSWF
jgi:hypothetical protein